jgi:hypothetical protein
MNNACFLATCKFDWLGILGKKVVMGSYTLGNDEDTGFCNL